MSARQVTSSVFSNPPLNKAGSEYDDIKQVRVRGTPLPDKESLKKFLLVNGNVPCDDIVDWVSENIDTTDVIRYESLDHSGHSLGSTTINLKKQNRSQTMTRENKDSVIDAETINKAASVGEPAMAAVMVLKQNEQMLEQSRILASVMVNQGKTIDSLAETLRKNNNGEAISQIGGLFESLKEEQNRRHRAETQNALLRQQLDVSGKRASDKKPVDTMLDAFDRLKGLDVAPEKMLQKFIEKLKNKDEMPKFIKALNEKTITELVEITASVSLICAEAAGKKDPDANFLELVSAKIMEMIGPTEE